MEPPVGTAFGRALAGGGVTEDLARISSAADSTVLLLLAAGIASMLKLVQGSGTVATHNGSAIVASLTSDLAALSFHPAYLVRGGGVRLDGSLLDERRRVLGGRLDVRL